MFLLSFLGFNDASSVFTTLSILDECIYIGVDVCLQFLYHQFHLLAQTDGVALRKINHAVEGVGDEEDRRQVGVRQVHVSSYLLTNGTTLVNAEDDVLGQALKLGWLKLISSGLVFEEQQQGAVPLIKSAGHLSNIFQRMVGRLLPHPYKARDKVATSCLRQDVHCAAIHLLEGRLRVEIANHRYSGG